jgi:hypothetical protein
MKARGCGSGGGPGSGQPRIEHRAGPSSGPGRSASTKQNTAGASPARNAARAARVDALVKKIGFLSFGHWSSSPGSHARSASDALLQSIDLAVAAEEMGADGAYFRVHHFARQLGSPFPLLAAIGARTSRIEIGTAVIDMATRTRCTWQRTPARPTSYRVAGSSWGSAAARRSR